MKRRIELKITASAEWFFDLYNVTLLQASCSKNVLMGCSRVAGRSLPRCILLAPSWSEFTTRKRFNWHAPDSKVHGANMGPIWGRQEPGGPQVGPMNLSRSWITLTRGIMEEKCNMQWAKLYYRNVSNKIQDSHHYIVNIWTFCVCSIIRYCDHAKFAISRRITIWALKHNGRKMWLKVQYLVL